MKTNECNIVQDLLPSYAEKLTSEDTNEYISKHLSECPTCSKIYEDLCNSAASTSDDKKFINYSKKFKFRFSILKWIIIILILIFLVTIIRKIVIIEDLNSKALEFANNSNYYSLYHQYNDDSLTIVESYNLDNKYYRTLKSVDKISGEITENIEEKYNGQTVETTIFDKSGNVLKSYTTTNINGIIPIEPKSYYLTFSTFSERLKTYIFCDIQETTFNGVECYRFTDLYNSQLGYNDYVYINKETGLPMRDCENSNDKYNSIREFYFEFNTVDEKTLEELFNK